MKNSENADTPISAIVYTPSPFRLSGKAAQASLRPLRSRSRISTPTLNQKTDAANIKKIANHSGHLELLARHEGICEPGGVLISSTAYDHVRGRINADFVDLGEKDPKNIARPVRVYSLASSAPAPMSEPPKLSTD